jgi:predicted secreted protein
MEPSNRSAFEVLSGGATGRWIPACAGMTNQVVAVAWLNVLAALLDPA